MPKYNKTYHIGLNQDHTQYIFDRHNCLSRNKSLLNFPFPHFKMTKISGNKKINNFLHYLITKKHFTKKFKKFRRFMISDLINLF